MDSYARAMDAGAAEWADVIDALKARGHDAYFTQTGGMCAAIEVDFASGYLLITDQEADLAWHRADHEGWLVGLYVDPGSTEAARYVESAQGDTAILIHLVEEALAPRYDANTGQWVHTPTGEPLSADQVSALGHDPGLRDMPESTTVTEYTNPCGTRSTPQPGVTYDDRPARSARRPGDRERGR
jgi:hypothetical protein